jgi:hypothetical protein
MQAALALLERQAEMQHVQAQAEEAMQDRM